MYSYSIMIENLLQIDHFFLPWIFVWANKFILLAAIIPCEISVGKSLICTYSSLLM